MGQAKLFCVKIVPKDFFKAEHRSTTKKNFLPWSTAPTETHLGQFCVLRLRKNLPSINQQHFFFLWVQFFHVEFKIVFGSSLSYIHILEHLFSSYPKIANFVSYSRNHWAITRSKKLRSTEVEQWNINWWETNETPKKRNFTSHGDNKFFKSILD